MRRLIAALVGVLVMSAATISARSSSTAATTETVTGEVISLFCYQSNHNYMRNTEQAYICNIGTVKYDACPVGLLTADGKVYQLWGGLVAANNAGIVPFLGHTVTITGSVYDVDGMTMLEAGLEKVKMVK